jgi:uncharacterized membrane protein YfcA
LLVVLATVLVAMWRKSAVRDDSAARPARGSMPGPVELAIGFATDFLDTLGIGSFATTTTAFRMTQTVDDRVIPGTMNVGHALPTVVQALVYITIIDVDMTTLVVMIGAAVLGAWFGSGYVARWPRRTVRGAIGVALLLGVGLLSLSALGFLPRGGTALALSGAPLVAGAALNGMFGALMTAGFGLYAPCMITVSVLGMNPTAAFPIMMGSCAFLMPVASARFIRSGAFDSRAALGLTLGGIPAVLIAAFLVRSLPLSAVRWLVVVVATYAAVSTLRAATRASP